MDEDYSEFITRKDFAGKYDFFHSDSAQTVIAVSSDPILMQKADRILWMQNGRILRQGTYSTLSQDPDFTMNCVFR
jgi:ABC-type transport system involved in cytochrome bd biosynthesis fused ATPase/permease subunit